MRWLLFIFLIIPSICLGDVRTDQPGLLIQTEDGGTYGRPRVLKTTNGSLTDNGDGSFSVTTGGGSGTSQWSDGVSGSIYYSGGNVGIGTLNSLSSGKLSVFSSFSQQIQLNRASDTSYNYPYIALRRARGNFLSPVDVEVGDYLGGLNAYGYYNGIQEGTSAILSRVYSKGASHLLGKMEFTVNDGTSEGSNFTSISTTSEDSSFLTPKNYFYGNVGIGTANPVSKLQVAGTNATSGATATFDQGININPVLNGKSPTLTLQSTSGNVDAGVHYYYTTFVTSIGETDLYPRSSGPYITADAGHGQVTVTVPTSTDYRVTKRKIYTY